MDVITVLMNATQLKYTIKTVCIICACLLFIAVLELPIKYYTFLRVIVFIGAMLIVITPKKTKKI